MKNKITVSVLLFILIFTFVSSKIDISNAAGELPATITTYDTERLGIIMNLFDYTTSDSSTNYPTHESLTGINQYTDLYFYGQGGTSSVTGGENTYTGGSIVRQGAIQSTLNSDHYPVSVNGKDLSMIYNSEEITGAKEVYEGVNYLFKRENGIFVYDGSSNYAYYNKTQGDAGDFSVYDSTYDIYEGTGNNLNSSNKQKVGFFPFDQYDPTKVDVGPSDDLAAGVGYNHHYGITIESDFHYTSDGLIDGNDIQFSVNGDDDCYVFLDDVLVLDLGGIHNTVGGSLNITTGNITIDNQVVAVQGHENDIIGATNTIDAVFASVGKTFDRSTNVKHTLKVFYTERGGYYSNVTIRTNVYNIAGEGVIDIPAEKVWDDNDSYNHKNDSVTIQLYADGAPVSGKTATLNKNNDWKTVFVDLPRYHLDAQGNQTAINYTIVETPVANYVPYYSKGITRQVVTSSSWTQVNDFVDGSVHLISTYNWRNNNQTIVLKKGNGEINSSPMTFSTAWGNVNLSRTPDEAELWTAHDAGNGTWLLENDGHYIAIYSNSAGTTSGVTVVDGYTVHDSNTGYYYGKNISFNGSNSKKLVSTFSTDQVTNKYWFYMVEGVDLAATSTNSDWAPDFNIYRRVDTFSTETDSQMNVVENVRQASGGLSVQKIVVRSQDSLDKNYSFRVTLSNANINGIYGDVQFVNGVANFTLKNGDTKQMTPLPVGTTYSIMEIDESETEEITKVRETGTISEGETISSVFRQVGFFALTVTKEWVDNNNAIGRRPSSINVQLYQDGVAYGNSVSLSSASNWTYTWPDLSGNYVWTVDELNTIKNYTKTITTVGDTVVITNTYVEPTKYTLSVDKVVTGNGGDQGKDFGFTISILDPDVAMSNYRGEIQYKIYNQNNVETVSSSFSNGSRNINLKHGYRIELQIPNELVYTVQEETNDYVTTINNVASDTKSTTGTISGNTSITFVNSKSLQTLTGVNINNKPYLQVLIEILIICVIIVLYKKRLYIKYNFTRNLKEPRIFKNAKNARRKNYEGP